MEPVYSSVITTARGVFAAQGLKFRMEGEDNVPRTGGAVMAINHTGYFDFTYAGLAARKSKRLVRFMAKQSIFSHRVAGPLMRGMKHIPVDRKDGRASFYRAVQALKDGEIVGVFPEATMSRSFELKEFKPGAVRMAQEAGVPILPTTLWGSQRVWSKNVPKHMGRSGIPIFITVGAPIHVAPDANRAEATAHLQEVMTAQLHAQQAAYPELTGDDLIYQPARLGGQAPTPDEAKAQDHHDMNRTVDKFNKGRKA
ncbi:lysophospholipid acyltransferase family protein [Knoellia subterranea]|uniref:Glycerol acyltransferase n=1 Tax=Knoellia subterranea KCTC 19937 TaxID=1385521 RepID=A0A0A0JPS2_9MICO|nr:lysophospholipid acyltransferase family protein [Knoellia subterranea]KGN39158.1 glycerol acyltransferase [Knoellia subterranea KCTC 19937]